jgi:hypothetical protein
MAAYQDVLVVPVPPKPELPNKAELETIRRAEAKEDKRVLASLEDRLFNTSTDTHSQNLNTPSLHRILIRAHEIMSRIEATRNLAVDSDKSTKKTLNYLPITVISIRECNAIVRISVSFFIFSYVIFTRVLMNDLARSEGRANCRTCIGNNEGMTFFFAVRLYLLNSVCRELVCPYLNLL